MKLTVRRSQSEKKGFFGGHKGMSFNLHCQVEISSAEKELINKYQANDYVLTWRQRDGGQVPGLKIRDLVQGTSTEVDDITTLLNNEQVIKSACKDFKSLLFVMATFGGEEVIEI